MTTWYTRVKSFFGIENKNQVQPVVNTLRGNFILKHDTPIHNDYYYNIHDKPIGKGSFGLVVRAVSVKTNTEFAIKIVNKSGNISRIEREIKLLADIDHINIIRLFSVYESQDTVRSV